MVGLEIIFLFATPKKSWVGTTKVGGYLVHVVVVVRCMYIMKEFA